MYGSVKVLSTPYVPRPGDVQEGAYLDDEGFVLAARRHPQQAHVGGFVDEVLDAVENSSSCGRDSPVDASLADGLPGDTGVSVDVLEAGRQIQHTETEDSSRSSQETISKRSDPDKGSVAS